MFRNVRSEASLEAAYANPSGRTAIDAVVKSLVSEGYELETAELAVKAALRQGAAIQVEPLKQAVTAILAEHLRVIELNAETARLNAETEAKMRDIRRSQARAQWESFLKAVPEVLNNAANCVLYEQAFIASRNVRSYLDLVVPSFDPTLRADRRTAPC